MLSRPRPQFLGKVRRSMGSASLFGFFGGAFPLAAGREVVVRLKVALLPLDISLWEIGKRGKRLCGEPTARVGGCLGSRVSAKHLCFLDARLRVIVLVSHWLTWCWRKTLNISPWVEV